MIQDMFTLSEATTQICNASHLQMHIKTYTSKIRYFADLLLQHRTDYWEQALCQTSCNSPWPPSTCRKKLTCELVSTWHFHLQIKDVPPPHLVNSICKLFHLPPGLVQRDHFQDCRKPHVALNLKRIQRKGQSSNSMILTHRMESKCSNSAVLKMLAYSTASTAFRFLWARKPHVWGTVWDASM